MDIALLIERIGSTQDSDDPGQRMIADSRQLDDNYRNNRPVRLLPPHLIYGNREANT